LLSANFSGKLTGYRHMALEIVDLLAKRLKQEYSLKFADSKTKNPQILDYILVLNA
jgi:glycerol-3-phosphate dehydrogenase